MSGTAQFIHKDKLVEMIEKYRQKKWRILR